MSVQISLKLESDRLIASHQELRRQRRELCRSSLTGDLINGDPSETLRPCKVRNGPTTRSKAKGRPTASKSNAQSKVDSKGPPTAHDSQGNALWTRPSDGKLVYLNCPMEGCDRTRFINVLAFRNHMSHVEGLHKLKRFSKSNDHAIETYGIVAPGQEGPVDNVNVTPVSVAPTANMQSVGVLAPTTSGSDVETASGLPLGLQTSVGSIGRWSTSSEAHRVKQLGRAYQATSPQTRSRAEQAMQEFNGYLSEESEDSDEDNSTTKRIPRTWIDQHRAARPKSPSATISLNQRKAVDTRAEASYGETEMVAQQTFEPAIKEERDGSSLFVEWQLADSPRTGSAITVAIGSGEETVAKSPKLATDTLGTRKRAASEFPTTPPPSSKRSRVEDESLTI